MHFIDLVEARTRSALLGSGRPVALGPGDVLMRRGGMGGDVFLVRSGLLEVVDPRGSPPLVLSVMEPGDMVGELGFVDAAPRSADVRAREPSQLLVWRRGQLQRLLRDDPVLSADFWEAVAEVAVQRVRQLTDTVRAGSLAQPVAAGAVDPAEVAELAADVQSAWARAQHPAEGDRPSHLTLAASLQRVADSLMRVGDPDRGDGLGATLAQELSELLPQARTSDLLLARPFGTPPPSAVASHVRTGVPTGRCPAGVALDQALLELPTLTGKRLFAQALGQLSGAQVLRLGPAHDPVALALGGTRDLPRNRDLIVVDAAFDSLPDRLLISLTLGLKRLLAPDGRLIVSHACPAWDDGVLDHLLRWPMLRRSRPTMTELLATAGMTSSLLPTVAPDAAVAAHVATVA